MNHMNPCYAFGRWTMNPMNPSCACVRWAGTPPMRFGAGGKLETPWGAGRWGPLDTDTLFVDFAGSQHNVEFSRPVLSRFTSSRCGDGDPVLGKLEKQ